LREIQNAWAAAQDGPGASAGSAAGDTLGTAPRHSDSHENGMRGASLSASNRRVKILLLRASHRTRPTNYAEGLTSYGVAVTNGYNQLGPFAGRMPKGESQ